MNRDELIDLVAPYTGIHKPSLGDLYDFVRGFSLPPGAVVQCGVVDGGSAVLLWHACGGSVSQGLTGHLWMFDSWEGLPEPGPKDGGKAHAKWDHKIAAYGSWCKGDIDKAREVARLGGVPKGKAHFVKGWFADTLPGASKRIGPIALLYLDADWYQSTMECLTYLYPFLAKGGLLMLDDYGYWPGCAEAVKDYGLEVTFTPPTGAYLVKP